MKYLMLNLDKNGKSIDPDLTFAAKGVKYGITNLSLSHADTKTSKAQFKVRTSTRLLSNRGEKKIFKAKETSAIQEESGEYSSTPEDDELSGVSEENEESSSGEQEEIGEESSEEETSQLNSGESYEGGEHILEGGESLEETPKEIYGESNYGEGEEGGESELEEESESEDVESKQIKLDNEDSKNEEEEYKQKQNANLHRDPGNKAVSHTPDVVKTLESVALNQEPNPQNSSLSKFPH